MDQIPNKINRLNWQDIKSRAREIILFLPHFLKNPINGMKRVPSWDWPTVLILEILITAATSVLGGILAHHWLAILGGVIFGPIMGLVISFILSGVLYYACLFILRTELEYRKIFTVVVLAKVPSQILSILSPIAKPITLFCLVVTALLLIVGLVENFMLDKKKVTQIVGFIAGFVILAWIYSTVLEATNSHIKVQDYTPESLDQIHKELGN
jgi:hypothetical protein